MSDLGYFDQHGDLIIGIIVISYLSMYTYLTHTYGSIDE
jgi:hypothetical protein